MWAEDRLDLRARVVLTTVFLFVAKLRPIAGPYFFKWETDALTGDQRLPLLAFLVESVILMVAYNVVRIVQLGFNQLREALFARVG